ncbi:MAG: YqaJ viral recombinase family protein [Acutalibacteraceae bacterium]
MPLPAAFSYAIEVVDTSGLSEEDWLGYRRQGIGGSDVAAIMGVSPFATLRDLYNDKCGNPDVIQTEDNWVAKEVGHRLEDLVAKIFAYKTGYKVFAVRKLFRHPFHSFMQANVDFFVELPDGSIAILECKTTNYNSKEKWNDGAVPVNYEWQCRHYMAVMNLSCAYIACLYGNNENEFVYRRIDRDEVIEADMIEMEAHFWNEYVLGRIEPPYTESGDLVLESIRRHYGELDPTVDAVILPTSMAVKLEQYLDLAAQKSLLSQQIKELDEQMKIAYAPIVDVMKTSCSAVCVFGSNTYEVRNKPVFRTSISKDKLQKLEETHPDLYSEYTETTEGRRFSVKRKENI